MNDAAVTRKLAEELRVHLRLLEGLLGTPEMRSAIQDIALALSIAGRTGTSNEIEARIGSVLSSGLGLKVATSCVAYIAAKNELHKHAGANEG